MEKSGKIEDGVMDNLLQSYVKRQMKPNSNCEAFDPDLANAYLERVMPQREQARYESHLSECALCRKQVIALARLVGAEVGEVKVAAAVAGAPVPLNESTADSNLVKPVSEERADWFARLKGWLGVLATPRFALAATAVIALAITLPVLLLLNSKHSGSDLAVATAPKVASPETQQSAPTNPSASNTSNPNPNNPSGDNQTQAANKQQAADAKASAPAAAANAPAAEASAAESGAGAGKAEKEEAQATATNEKAKREEAAKTPEAAGSTTQPEAAKPQPAATVKPDALDRIDPNEAKRIDSEKDNASPPTTLKQGNTSDGSKSKKNAPTVGPDSPKPAAPPSARSNESSPKGFTRGGRGFKEPSENAGERANASASRRIGKKTFWLVDDIWTDENYRSDKEMPIVPLIKDSENYKNELEKHPDLKKIFSAFGANERAIVVRKDMAYKLIPQDGNK